jgi:hypothetical protein
MSGTSNALPTLFLESDCTLLPVSGLERDLITQDEFLSVIINTALAMLDRVLETLRRDGTWQMKEQYDRFYLSIGLHDAVNSIAEAFKEKCDQDPCSSLEQNFTPYQEERLRARLPVGAKTLIVSSSFGPSIDQALQAALEHSRGMLATSGRKYTHCLVQMSGHYLVIERNTDILTLKAQYAQERQLYNEARSHEPNNPAFVLTARRISTRPLNL